MSADLSCAFTESPSADELDVVDAGLHLHNLHAVDLGAVQGGLRARQWGAAVEVQQLWVEPARRRQGVARRLMCLLEEEVRHRGARLVYLDTFSFQAQGFYQRCGYRAALRLDGFPDGIAKYVMVKRLDGEALA